MKKPKWLLISIKSKTLDDLLCEKVNDFIGWLVLNKKYRNINKFKIEIDKDETYLLNCYEVPRIELYVNGNKSKKYTEGITLK